MSEPANQTLLTYSITTNPSPLETSPQLGDPSLASLTISARISHTVYIESIILSFDVGDSSQDLTEVSSGILSSCSPSNVWQIAQENNGDQMVFIVTPLSGTSIGITGSNQPTITIQNVQVSTLLGTAVLAITENSSTTNGNFTAHTDELLLVKTPVNFVVHDFASQNCSVGYGGTATLSWLGARDPNTRYFIYGPSTPSVDVSNQSSWRTPALYQTTTFVLRTETPYQGETLTKYQSVTVAVVEEDVNAYSLTVANSAIFNGAATFNRDSTFSGGTFNSTLTCNGPVTVNASLTVTGTINIGSATSGTSRYLYLYGQLGIMSPSNGHTMASLTNPASGGKLTLYNSSQQTAVQCYVDGNGNGDLYVYDNSTRQQHMRMYVDDTDGYSLISVGSAYMRGNGVKNFRLPHPSQPETDIWYACPEGPEAAIYVRGTATLVNGKSQVELPEHFAAIAGEKLITVTLTPLSADSLGLAVIHKSIAGFEVRELHRGGGNYEFDWEVKAMRRDAEDYQVLRPRREK